MERTSNFKNCIVPECMNNSLRTPNKVFITVPSARTSDEFKRRRLWFKAIRREKRISNNTKCYVCQDHFNLEEDMDNYIKWKLVGGPIFMKKNIIPHIFECQSGRKRTHPPPERKSSSKRARKEIIQQLLENDNKENQAPEEVQNIFTADKEICNEVSVSSSPVAIPEMSIRCASVLDIGCQVDAIKYESRGVQTKRINFKSKSIQTDKADYIINIKNVASPLKISPLTKFKSTHTSTVSKSGSSSSIDSVNFSISEYPSTTDLSMYSKDSCNLDSDERNLYLCKKKCRFYLGIPNDCYFIVSLLSKTIKCPVRDIFITLKKIRTNMPFEMIADDFGISITQAAKCFNKTITSISYCLKTYIFWPEKEKIKKLLPLAFRANYYNIESIIDCFEIQIEKPEDPIKQASTWSDYKKANTFKYLISITPDGFINYISKGFGGRATDVAIVKKSGYLEICRKHSSVMADRGFKQIDTLLQPLHCTLVRPPSVQAGKKSSKAEVLETKRIASLRIHVERVIRRIREFKILKPHSVVNNKLIKYLDHMVIIACGLVNLQSEIIKL